MRARIVIVVAAIALAARPALREPAEPDAFWLESRFALPPLAWTDGAGAPHRLDEIAGRPILITLWRSTSAESITAFGPLARGSARLTDAGVGLVALATDGPETRRRATRLARRLDLPFATGFDASPSPLTPASALWRAVTSGEGEPPLPVSLLLDAQGRIARVYTGAVIPAAVAADVNTMAGDGGAADARPTELVVLLRDLVARERFATAAFYAERLAQYLDDEALPVEALGDARNVIHATASAVSDDDPALTATLCRRLLVEFSDDPIVLLTLTDALMKIGTPDVMAEAVDHFDAALMFMPRPETRERWMALGETLFRLEQWAEAVPYLRHALDERGQPVHGRAQLGLALIRAGRAAEGIPHLASALAELPTNAFYELTLAQALQREGRHDEAIEHYERAAATGSLDANARWNHGSALLAAGRTADAIRHLAGAIDELPADASRDTALGIALARSNRLEEAATRFESAVRLAPDDVTARHSLAMTLEALGRPADAVPHLQRVSEAVPGNLDVLERLAGAQRAAGDLPASVASYRRLLQAKPDHQIAMYRLAWLLASAPDASVRNGAEAVRYATTLCAGADKEATLLDLLAAAQAEAGAFDDAVATATEAIAIAKSKNRPDIVEQIETRLALYRAGKPFRAPA